MGDAYNQYAPMRGGISPLREAIAELLLKYYGHQADPYREVTITVDASEALFCAIFAITQPHDEVIVLEPAYDLYRSAIIKGGGIPVGVHTFFENNQLAIDWSAVAAAITSCTRAIIINTPNNLTGSTFSNDDFIELESLAEQHDLWIISDEAYEHMLFDDVQHIFALSCPKLFKRTIYIASFDKTLHVTAWKFGYMVTPSLLSEVIRSVYQFNVFFVAILLQYAITDYLTKQPQAMSNLLYFYQAKCDAFCAGLMATKVKLLPVKATYSQLLDYSAIPNFGGLDDVAFAKHLRTQVCVAAIPLSAFYGVAPAEQKIIRLCFAKKDGDLKLALERLNQYFGVI
jgi:methionine aminotransferase